MQLVKLANQLQQVMGRGIDVATEFGDLITEFLAVRLLELRMVLNRYDGGGHGGFPA